MRNDNKKHLNYTAMHLKYLLLCMSGLRFVHSKQHLQFFLDTIKWS